MVRTLRVSSEHHAGHREARRGTTGIRDRVGADLESSKPTSMTATPRASPPTRPRECWLWSKSRVAPGQRDSQTGCFFLRGGARPPTQEIVAFIVPTGTRSSMATSSESSPSAPPCASKDAGSSEHVLRRGIPATLSTNAAGCCDGPGGAEVVGGELRVYGARKIWKAAHRAGHQIGRDRVARLMRAEGYRRSTPHKTVRTTRRNPEVARHLIWWTGSSPPRHQTSCGSPI